jgi:small conductance mechanosensitive channel
METTPRMRLIALTVLGLWLTLAPGFAQPAAPARPQPGAEELIRLLEDDAARNALIARLRAAEPAQGQAAGAAGSPAALPESLQVPEEPTLARQLAEYTKAVAERAASMAQVVTGLAVGLGQVLGGVSRADPGRFWAATLNIVLVGLVVFGVCFVLRLGAVPLTRRLALRAERGHWLVRLALVLGAVLLDAATVVLAWGAGYAFALNYGAFGQMGINQTLLLNAFMMVEGLKVLLRAVLMPQWPSLRLIPLGEAGTRAWYFWLSRAISVLGYTFMFVAPVLNAGASYAAAQSLRVVVMFGMLVLGIVAVLRHRRAGQHWIERRHGAKEGDAMGRAHLALAHGWHVLVIIWLLALFTTWMSNPRAAMGFMLAATARSVVLLLVGGLVLGGMRRLFAGGVQVPAGLQDRLPLLQTHLNTFIPTTVQVVRSVVLVCVLLALLQIWGAVDFLAWLDTDRGRRMVGSMISAGVILLVGAAVYIGMSSWVEYRLNPNYGSVPTSRERTLLTLFRNGFTIALVILVAMLALSEIGVNIGPLLAGAGVLGLAIGFGAQKLVQDIITGIFIQFENAMNVGDSVSLGGISGSVEKLTIRSVTLRGGTGAVHVIPFSSVSTVSNMSRGFGVHEQTVEIAHDQDVEAAKAALVEAFDRLQKTPHAAALIAPLDLVGVTGFGPTGVTLKANLKAMANQQGGPGRAFGEFIKQVFDERGIVTPVPQMTVHVGRSNVLPLRVVDAAAGAGPRPGQEALPAGPAPG